MLLCTRHTASGRGAVPGVEAVERARAVPLLLAPGLGAEKSRVYVNATLVVGPRSGAVRIVTPSGCETPAGEACATPASFVWRFQAALNAFWDLGRGADDKGGGFLAGSALGHGSLVDE